MAVEILVLAQDGPDREAGTIVDIRECPNDEHAKWGKQECPPRFHIIRIEGVGKKSLPPFWLEYGGHKSRAKLDFRKLPSQLRGSRFRLKRLGLKFNVAKLAIQDKGHDWNPLDWDEIG